MSHYLAAGIALLLLVAVALGGWQVSAAIHMHRAVDVALMGGQGLLALDGGVSARVRRRVTERLAELGLDPEQAQVRGSRPGQPRGTEVWLEVSYRHPVAYVWPTGLLGAEGQQLDAEVTGRAYAISAREG